MAKMTVISERCKGCGLCTAACPKKIVEIQKEKRNKKGYFYAKLVQRIVTHTPETICKFYRRGGKGWKK